MTAPLLFELDPVETPGPVALTFGERSARVALVFSQPPVPTPGPVRLLFGALAAPPPELVEATVGFALPAPTVAVRLAPPNDATVAFVIPGLSVAAVCEHDMAVSRPTVAQGTSAHQAARALPASGEFAHQAARALPVGAASPHGPALSLRAAVQHAAQPGQGVRSAGEARHTEAFALRRPTGVRHQAGFGARLVTGVRHQEAQRRSARAFSRHQERLREPRPVFQVAHREGKAWRRAYVAASGIGQPALLRRVARHQEAMRPPAGRWAGPVVPPFDPCYLPDPNLLFSALAPASTGLVFICERRPVPQPGATLVIPVRRVYMVTNNLSLVRTADGEPLRASAARLSLDVDSWTWGFSATVQGDSLGLLNLGAGDRTELTLTVNGTAVRVLAEDVRRSRRFGSSVLEVSGRGRNAVLGAPYAPALSFTNGVALTAQQLAEAALTADGVPLGWALDWQLEDWLVPAGAWAVTGAHMDAVLGVAAAAGGYVQPENTAKGLIVLPRYPALPRDWGSLTPDIELPSALVTVEGIAWSRKPDYDRVFVHGSDIGGVLVEATLLGAAGELTAPAIVDPLITDVIAGRQRARSVLGDTGNQAQVSLRVPLLPELGIVKPGKLVRYVDGATTRLGLVRSTSVEAALDSTWLNLEVETHA